MGLDLFSRGDLVMEDNGEVKTELLPLVYYGHLWIICYVTLTISFLLVIQLFLI